MKNDLPDAKFTEENPSDVKFTEDNTPDPLTWLDWATFVFGIFFIILQWRNFLIICDDDGRSGFGSFLLTICMVSTMGCSMEKRLKSSFHSLSHLSYLIMFFYYLRYGQ